MTDRLLDGIHGPADLKRLPESDLPRLAEEVREELIRVVSQTGGHMGSNLGVVELTLALHRVYDAERDLFVWDVSNQTYIHKMLTGRRERLPTIRQYGGISGFGNRDESPYDPFTFGHAGTAASAALGIVEGDAQLKTDRHVVAVVGDGAMTEGMSYEALNNAGGLRRRFLIILNDNSWSIAPTTGALSSTLNELRTRPTYVEAKKWVWDVLHQSPLGKKILDTMIAARRGIKAALLPNLFTDLGLLYYGPFDGHDVHLMIRVLKNVREWPAPVLLHVVTKKGKGHPHADTDPYKVHAVSPKTKEQPVEPGATTKPPPVAYTKAFSKALVALGNKEPKLVAITAAMPDGTGLVDFARVFPDRFYDVGICEQHAVGFAAGMAHAGMRPLAAIYSTFLQRAFDQVFQEMCLQNLPVALAMDRGGIAGADGPTHNGLYDIAYLRALPNIALLAPKDGPEFAAMLEWMAAWDGPSAVRYPRANVPDFSAYALPERPIELGRGEVLVEGAAAAFLAYGAMVEQALAAREKLLAQGIEVTVANARFAKPIDRELVAKLLAEHPLVVTLEEHSVCGGFGAAVLEVAADARLEAGRLRVWGVPDRFLTHGDRSVLLKEIGLDGESLAKRLVVELKTVEKPRRARVRDRAE